MVQFIKKHRMAVWPQKGVTPQEIDIDYHTQLSAVNDSRFTTVSIEIEYVEYVWPPNECTM